MNILCTICMRGGSKEIVNKNIKKLRQTFNELHNITSTKI